MFGPRIATGARKSLATRLGYPSAMKQPRASYDNFLSLQLTVGKIVEVQDFERARNPSYKVRIDFGPEKGERWSVVQAKNEYSKEELVGRFIIAVLNFAPRNIAGFQSEVLILGVPAEDGSLSLLEPSRGAKIGGMVY
ncbi:MAG TPA: tRNA-binding protein [Gammaproteobacteria bacterium]|jgi:tRNA-binding protein|nr:tRNA-binding protein [Gammaproteobacteria bacterium]